MAILLGLLSATQPGDSLPRFPVVEGKNLEGRSFQLPRDFEGDLNVVVVAFRREQQAAVDTWMPALKELKAEHPGLHVYELPTMARSYRLMRSFIDWQLFRSFRDRAFEGTRILSCRQCSTA